MVDTPEFPEDRVEKKSDMWQNIVIVLLLFLGVYFVVTIKNSNNTYKDEISSLERTIDTLESEMSGMVHRDSILYYISAQGKLEDVIAELNSEVDSLKDIEHEDDIYFDNLSTDSNIVVLSGYLSE